MTLTRPIKPPRPPLLPPPVVPLNLDCTKSFITVIAAPLTASCLLPDAAPPALSNNLEASAIARLINCDWEPPPPPPEVKPFKTYEADMSIFLEIMILLMEFYLKSCRAAHGACAQTRGIALAVSLLMGRCHMFLIYRTLMLILFFHYQRLLKLKRRVGHTWCWLRNPRALENMELSPEPCWLAVCTTSS